MTKKFAYTKFEGFTEIADGETVPITKKLTAKEMAVLQVIAMFQSEGGYCDTTQDQITGMLNMSKRSVIETIKKLKEFTYGGKHVIKITTKRNKDTGKLQNVYQLLPNDLFGVYGEEIFSAESARNNNELGAKIALNSAEKEILGAESAPTKEIVSKEFTKELINKEKENQQMKNNELLYVFLDSYKEKYLTEYKRSYKLDNKSITTFKSIVGKRTEEELKRIIQIIVEQYSEWSSDTKKYPLTTRTLTLQWVVDKSIAILDQEKNNKSQIENKSVEANKRTNQSISSIMSRFGKE